MCSYHLIVLEGLDCSGKTTVCRRLACSLHPCTKLAFPDRFSKIGQITDGFLKNRDEWQAPIDPHELHLLFSADRYEKSAYIEETLRTSHVVCDRYWYSGTAYSAAKGLSYEWCKSVDMYLPKPDFVFFLDVSAETVSKRRGFGKEAHDSVEFQEKVYDMYKRLAEEEQMISIDGTKGVEAIVMDILDATKSKSDK